MEGACLLTVKNKDDVRQRKDAGFSKAETVSYKKKYPIGVSDHSYFSH